MDWSNLREDYERLGSFTAVASEYGVSKSLISQKVKQQGWKRQIDWSDLPSLYEGGMTYEHLATHYSVSMSTVCNKIREMGVTPRHTGSAGYKWTDEQRAKFQASIERGDHEWTEERRAAHRAAIDSPEWRAKNREHLQRTRATTRRVANSPSEILFQQALTRADIGFTAGVPMLGRYSADILIRQAAVVVEIDGWSHRLRGDRDQRRDAAFADAGYRVFRFTNEQVDTDADGCVRIVIEACGLAPEEEPVFVVEGRRPGMRGEQNPNWLGGKPERMCAECGKPFLAQRYRKRSPARFCTRQCYWQWMRLRPRDQRKPVDSV